MSDETGVPINTAENGGSGVKLTPGPEEIKRPGWPESIILNSYFL